MRVKILDTAFDDPRKNKDLVGLTGDLVHIDPKNGFGFVNAKVAGRGVAQIRVNLTGLARVR